MPAVTAMMARTEKLTLFAEPTLNSSPASLSAGPTWSIDNGLLASITPSADGLSCVVTALGGTGVVNVTCSGTGQSNGSPVSLSQVAQITIVSSYANVLGLTVGPITAQ